MSRATVKEQKSYGSIWAKGDAIWGYERGQYWGMLCIRAREIGPKGGIRSPARSVHITGPTWDSVKRAVSELGFTMPRLTAEQVRLGKSEKR